jgi:hypothetical protein
VRRILILAEPADAGAHAVAAVLRARVGADAVCVASGQAIAFAPRLVHRAVATEITLADGSRLTRELIGAVLCRVAGAEAPWAGRASPPDAAYASGEAFALLLAWLAGLERRVVNAPSPTGLAGPARTPAQWLALAAEAGLPTARLRHTTNARALARPGFRAHRLGAVEERAPAIPFGRRPATFVEPLSGAPVRMLVAGDEVLGPASLHDGCRTLARMTGCSLLGLVFRDSTLVGVDPVPALTGPGEPEAVAAHLERLAA